MFVLEKTITTLFVDTRKQAWNEKKTLNSYLTVRWENFVCSKLILVLNHIYQLWKTADREEFYKPARARGNLKINDSTAVLIKSSWVYEVSVKYLQIWLIAAKISVKFSAVTANFRPHFTTRNFSNGSVPKKEHLARVNFDVLMTPPRQNRQPCRTKRYI